MNTLINKIARIIRAHRLGYRASQLVFGPDGDITEAKTGREICPFILAPIETEEHADHTLIRIFDRNSNTVVSEVIGLEGEAA
ncbi:hypothetical protein [Phaeobacter piscinae]|uniref:hypothetical protein n=1 Tax=Phaeobacter piscinae TaxID=1580596 RepID=UPI00058EB3CD|nr:hypothetical protein [Phaeobacter piscinae]UTS82850.1 hypothetical protein OL67_003960 [Phaeobacter piscinae]